MMDRLNTSTVSQLSTQIRRPSYERGALQSGIVHLGLGAFHRAHQAFYTDLAITDSGGDWGIRMKPADSPDDWDLANETQFGEPYLMLMDEGAVVLG